MWACRKVAGHFGNVEWSIEMTTRSRERWECLPQPTRGAMECGSFRRSQKELKPLATKAFRVEAPFGSFGRLEHTTVSRTADDSDRIREIMILELHFHVHLVHCLWYAVLLMLKLLLCRQAIGIFAQGPDLEVRFLRCGGICIPQCHATQSKTRDVVRESENSPLRQYQNSF